MSSPRLTEEHYWTGQFRSRSRRPDYRGGSDLRSHARQQVHEFLSAQIGDGNGRRLIEVGCADSSFLPYFRREFGLRVAGLDYSEPGCEMARERLRASGEPQPEVINADLFALPARLQNQFDLVFSYGLVEHFQNATEVTALLRSLLKPGGKIITLVPNIAGVPGFFQRMLHRPIWDMHLMYDPRSLRAIHEASGFETVTSRYLVGFNLGVCNPGLQLKRNAFTRFVTQAVFRMMQATTVAWWIGERLGLGFKPNRLLSPYVIYVGCAPHSVQSRS